MTNALHDPLLNATPRAATIDTLAWPGSGRAQVSMRSPLNGDVHPHKPCALEGRDTPDPRPHGHENRGQPGETGTSPHVASPVTITALDGNYADFLLALKRPRPLEIENSNAALLGRIDEIEHHIAAFKAWLTALVEDTARNVALAKRPDDIVDSHMTDMAGDLRGALLQALERNAA